jgi:hypothetical protein
MCHVRMRQDKFTRRGTTSKVEAVGYNQNIAGRALQKSFGGGLIEQTKLLQ